MYCDKIYFKTEINIVSKNKTRTMVRHCVCFICSDFLDFLLIKCFGTTVNLKYKETYKPLGVVMHTCNPS